MILAIDPGNEESAYVSFVDGEPFTWKTCSNSALLVMLRGWECTGNTLAVEMIASYGMPVGREVFDTCVWIGRFLDAWESRGGKTELVYRKDVKMFLCGSMQAKDANIRQALIDRFGGKAAAIGKKRSPGPLFGLTGDCWSALAVAVTAAAKPPQRAANEGLEGIL